MADRIGDRLGRALLVGALAASALLGCGASPERDGGPAPDAGPRDAGEALDAGTVSDGAAPGDAAGPRDGGSADAARDAGDAPDAGDGSDAGEDAGVDALPYPTRTAMRIKEIQPDFWPSVDEIAGNNAGGISVNMVWAHWQPTRATAPCAAAEVEFDGHCFTVSAQTDAAVEAYSARGMLVTAIVYGVPAWARAAREARCSAAAPGFEIFCAPDDATDYGRFAGMLAQRYDGRRGHGRIADFVIHNEVNSNTWFDVGCGAGTPCDPDEWIRTYAESYRAAYDAIVAQQRHAKVFFSFEHHFAASYDAPARAPDPLLGVETFLGRLVPMIGERDWRVAYHPYPPDLRVPSFGADDWPRVTFGNIGTLVGWLHQRYPSDPHAWEVHLTEQGLSSEGGAETAQASALCATFENILGTPGIESYVYHRMQDHPDEGGLQLGLRRYDGTAKPSWATWALANRADLDPPMLSCGFERLPYVRLTRSYHPSRGHWVSTRQPPAGFTEERAWRLPREREPGTRLLFSCVVGGHTFLTLDPGCEGQRPEGPVGWIYESAAAGRVALYRCRVGAGTDHFASPDAGCEGATMESRLGYALSGT